VSSISSLIGGLLCVAVVFYYLLYVNFFFGLSTKFANNTVSLNYRIFCFDFSAYLKVNK